MLQKSKYVMLSKGCLTMFMKVNSRAISQQPIHTELQNDRYSGRPSDLGVDLDFVGDREAVLETALGFV